MTKRLAVARLWLEVNSFSPVPTVLEDFEAKEWVRGPDVLKTFAGTPTELGAVAAFAEAHPDWDVQVLRCAAAEPGGPMDDALFDSDLTRINSQGNFGSQTSRPEAWAKNIISVGGIWHLNDLFAGNDSWAPPPGDTNVASIGPAADGRLKVEPLARFTAADLKAYMEHYRLPPHPLVVQGYRSIGCVPCTVKGGSSDNPRAGRWVGRSKEECGIHWTVNGQPVRLAKAG